DRLYTTYLSPLSRQWPSVVTAFYLLFFFNAPPPPHLYTLSLHDALPISPAWPRRCRRTARPPACRSSEEVLLGRTDEGGGGRCRDRKSTRLNSSHRTISYAVFCLKKKKKQKNNTLNNKQCRQSASVYSSL